jgi:heme-degrading monooxygenase HmoA
MYARVVELVVQPGRLGDFCTTLREHVLPMLKTAPGFIDLTAIVSQDEPRLVLKSSIWRTKEDAERYTREQFPIVREMLQPMIERRSEVRNFDVCVSASYEAQAVPVGP